MKVNNKCSGIKSFDRTHSKIHATMHMVVYKAIWMMHNSVPVVVIILMCPLPTNSK